MGLYQGTRSHNHPIYFSRLTSIISSKKTLQPTLRFDFPGQRATKGSMTWSQIRQNRITLSVQWHSPNTKSAHTSPEQQQPTHEQIYEQKRPVPRQSFRGSWRQCQHRWIMDKQRHIGATCVGPIRSDPSRLSGAGWEKVCFQREPVSRGRIQSQ